MPQAIFQWLMYFAHKKESSSWGWQRSTVISQVDWIVSTRFELNENKDREHQWGDRWNYHSFSGVIVSFFGAGNDQPKIGEQSFPITTNWPQKRKVYFESDDRCISQKVGLSSRGSWKVLSFFSFASLYYHTWQFQAFKLDLRTSW